MNIQKMIQRVTVEIQTPNAYSFLPEILETLEAMAENEKASTDKRKQLVRGLGRLVTDSLNFPNPILAVIYLN